MTGWVERARRLRKVQDENAALKTENESLLASLEIVDARLADDDGYGPDDRIRFARLHIDAVRTGAAKPTTQLGDPS